jgi:tRNA (guanine-N7-)-methyltransferase
MTETIPTTSDSTIEQPPRQASIERRIRSFVLRTGRMGTGQERAIAELGPRFVLPFEAKLIDLDSLKKEAVRVDSTGTIDQNNFKKSPVVLEIGFGMGDATAKIAHALPDSLFIACEVHTPGVGALLRLIGDQRIPNIRIVQHDAVEVLSHMFGAESLDGIHIFFPDPWHKKRHNKRRLIQTPFIANVVKHLKPGGYLHLATDWQPYAEQMLQVLRSEPQLRNTAADYAPRPDYRPETKFERRGLRLGHGVWDLVFERI